MTAEAFWNFSLDRYGRDGVSKTCLELQDDIGADVNVLLLCLWCGQSGYTLSRDQLVQLMGGEAGRWHRDIVRPLRAARKAMKGRVIAGEAEAVEDFRTQIKKIEIESEKWEQRSLAAAVERMSTEALVDTPPDACARIATANLEIYIGLVVPNTPNRDQHLLTKLVEACIE